MPVKQSILTFSAAAAIVLLAASARAQTDVALSIYGAFSGATNGNGVQDSPSNSAGGLFGIPSYFPSTDWMGSHISYNRANQVYSTACGANVTCAPTTRAASLPMRMKSPATGFRPFTSQTSGSSECSESARSE